MPAVHGSCPPSQRRDSWFISSLGIFVPEPPQRNPTRQGTSARRIHPWDETKRKDISPKPPPCYTIARARMPTPRLRPAPSNRLSAAHVARHVLLWPDTKWLHHIPQTRQRCPHPVHGLQELHRPVRCSRMPHISQTSQPPPVVVHQFTRKHLATPGHLRVMKHTLTCSRKETSIFKCP